MGLEWAHLLPAPTGPEAGSLLSSDFTEVGASGRWMEYADAVNIVEQRRSEDVVPASVEGASVRLLAPGVALLTYELHTAARVTRRASVWRDGPSGWQLTFNQGTPTTTGQ